MATQGDEPTCRGAEAGPQTRSALQLALLALPEPVLGLLVSDIAFAAGCRGEPAAAVTPPPGLAPPPGLVGLARPDASASDPAASAPSPPLPPAPAATAALASATGPDLGAPADQPQSHEAGTCKPCLYFNSGLCHKGRSCTFCHLPHNKRRLIGVRPSKRTRECLERRVRRAAQLQMMGEDAAVMRFHV